jgi:hypothetical protein
MRTEIIELLCSTEEDRPVRAKYPGIAFVDALEHRSIHVQELVSTGSQLGMGQ